MVNMEISTLGEPFSADDPFEEGNKENLLLQREHKVNLVTMPSGSLLPGLPHPLSFNEEQFFQLWSGDPRNYRYNIPIAFQPRQILTPQQCTHAFHILINRHDILRATYTYAFGNGSTPSRMLTNNRLVYTLAVEEAKDGFIMSSLDTTMPFALGVASARFLSCSTGKKGDFPVIHANIHHIIADGDSAGLVGAELDAIYTCLVNGLSEEEMQPHLPSLPVQFMDFAYWQTTSFARGDIEPDMAFWYSDVSSTIRPMVLDLPLDFPRRRVWEAQGASRRHAISMDLVELVARKCAVTPYVVVFTAMIVAMSRMTGCRNNIIAAAHALRAQDELRNLIGNFLNMCPSQVVYEETESFFATVERVGEVAKRQQKHSLAPWVKVVGETRRFYNPPFDPARNPVYQSMIDVVPNNDDESQVGLAGVLDLHLFVNATNGVFLSIDGVYNTSILDDACSKSLLFQVVALTRLAAAKASSPVASDRLFRVPQDFGCKEEVIRPRFRDPSLGTAVLNLRPGPVKCPTVVDLRGGAELEGVPEDMDFLCRSRRFAKHSGCSIVTDHLKSKKTDSPPIERRVAPDGQAYTQKEFEAFYGGLSEWEKAPRSGAVAPMGLKAMLSPVAKKRKPKTEPRACQMEGKIRTYNNDSEFGTIACEGLDAEIYFNQKALPFGTLSKKGGTAPVIEGRRVGFNLRRFKGDKLASGIRFLE